MRTIRPTSAFVTGRLKYSMSDGVLMLVRYNVFGLAGVAVAGVLFGSSPSVVVTGARPTAAVVLAPRVTTSEIENEPRAVPGCTWKLSATF